MCVGTTNCVVCAVCLLWVLSSAFCCSFSEIYTVGLNGLLRQPSGSAFSNTHSLTSTHKHTNNPFYSHYNNPQRNLKGFPFVSLLNFWDMQMLCTLIWLHFVLRWYRVNINEWQKGSHRYANKLWCLLFISLIHLTFCISTLFPKSATDSQPHSLFSKYTCSSSITHLKGHLWKIALLSPEVSGQEMNWPLI